jgi:hypothetical protein
LSSWYLSSHSMMISQSAGSGIIHLLRDRRALHVDSVTKRDRQISQNSQGIPTISRLDEASATIPIELVPPEARISNTLTKASRLWPATKSL